MRLLWVGSSSTNARKQPCPGLFISAHASKVITSAFHGVRVPYPSPSCSHCYRLCFGHFFKLRLPRDWVGLSLTSVSSLVHVLLIPCCIKSSLTSTCYGSLHTIPILNFNKNNNKSSSTISSPSQAPGIPWVAVVTSYASLIVVSRLSSHHERHASRRS